MNSGAGPHFGSLKRNSKGFSAYGKSCRKTVALIRLRVLQMRKYFYCQSDGSGASCGFLVLNGVKSVGGAVGRLFVG